MWVVSLAASMVGLMAVLWALEWVVWKVDKWGCSTAVEKAASTANVTAETWVG